MKSISVCCGSPMNDVIFDDSIKKQCSKCLLLSKSNNNGKLKIAIKILFSVLLMFPLLSSPDSLSRYNIYYNKDIISDSIKVNKFSYEKLKKLLIDSNVKFLDIALKQSKEESGNYKSDLFKYHNNIFGIQYHKSKKIKISKFSFIDSDNNMVDFCNYEKWEDSVIDYIDWINSNFGEKQLYELLDKRYCPNQDYSKRLKKIDVS